MRLKAYAKVNWSLAVRSRREDGYHELDTIMQSASLCDDVEILPSDDLTLEVDGAGAPSGAENLVMRAAEALRCAAGVRKGASMRLTKRIPVGAGLGGGSADAAAALLGLRALWGLEMGERALSEIALGLGADVPFCLVGGLARARGVGEKLTWHEAASPLHLIVIQPCAGLSTPSVFAAYDRLSPPPVNPDVEAALSAAICGDARALAEAMGNALEPAALPLRPEIAACALAMENAGALRARMTGSGSAVVGLFVDETKARQALIELRRAYHHAALARTMPRGVVLI